MGFERITAVLQKKDSNYDTDIFTPIFAAIQRITGAPPYGAKMDDMKDTAYRVIADHIRALAFAIADGGVPSNEKRGYVLRSILRRAERYGWQHLGTKKPFLFRLVPTVVEVMGQTFPELTNAGQRVSDVVREEESGFLRTLERGLKLFQEAAGRARERGTGIISGKDAFNLHTEQGVYIDIVEQMASEAGLKVDRAGYEQLYLAFQQDSGKGRKKHVVSAIHGELPQTDDAPKYALDPIDATVTGWVKDNVVVREGTVPVGEEVAVILDQTNFYAEQGGQVGDSGTISWDNGRFEVDDAQKIGDTVLHCRPVRPWDSCGWAESPSRREGAPDTMRNHTATHLLNWALRKVLGDHIEQKGSLVDAEKTRFDFAHTGPLTPVEITEVDRLVNQRIYADLPVTPVIMPLAQAKKVPAPAPSSARSIPTRCAWFSSGPKGRQKRRLTIPSSSAAARTCGTLDKLGFSRSWLRKRSAKE